MKRIIKSQVLQMHSLLIKQTGGIDGVRDEGLLDSALNAPFQSFDGEDIYKTIQSKAARLGFSLINNHPFIDGNKRIGILSMIVFLEINGIEVICTNEELIELGLGLANGTIDHNSLLNWLIGHS
ncbi:MAG: type II toxin-antitoxin system death-on-curing family toxin [Desulfitobacteriaceae bacterium]|nr:type II toxin-antitoxin system death-on-curing family toxin [Desulfitobacteriaceae bacterium]